MTAIERGNRISDLAGTHRRRKTLTEKNEQILTSTLHDLQLQLVNTADSRRALCQRFLYTQQSQLLDELLNDETIDGAIADPVLNQHQRDELRSVVQTLAHQISVQVPIARFETNVVGAAAFAAIGAVAGILFLGPFVHWLLGWPGEVGVLVGGPVGAALATVLLYLIVRSPALADSVKWLLGVVAIADLTITILDHVRPNTWLRMKLFGGQAPKVSLGKRLLVYASIWVLLKLAKPVQMSDTKDVLKSARESLEHWLSHQIDLILLCAVHLRLDTRESGADFSEEKPFLEAVRSLLHDATAHQDDQERLAGTAQHFRSLMESRGYGLRHLDQSNGQAVYCEELQKYFDPFGRVSAEDTITLLEPALLRDGEVVLRGVVQRKR